MRSVVVSFFDSLNLGDLLISQCISEFAAKYGEVDRLSISGDPFAGASLDNLPEFVAGRVTASGFRARAVSTTLGGMLWRMREGFSARHERVLSKLSGSDLVILGGGNMMFDVESWTRSSARADYFLGAARSAGVPSVGMSLGIGPFATVRQHRNACRVLDKCDGLTFRDRASLELYMEYGRKEASISVDPVLLLDRVVDRPRGVTGHVAWNLVEPSVTGLAAVREQVVARHASAIRGALLDGWVVDVFSTDRADEGVLRELVDLVGSPSCSFVPINGFAALLELYGRVDVVISSRMHALIVAFTQGLPILGLVWQEKVVGLFERLGRPEQVFQMQDLDGLEAGLAEVRRRPAEFAMNGDDRALIREMNSENERLIERFALP